MRKLQRMIVALAGLTLAAGAALSTATPAGAVLGPPTVGPVFNYGSGLCIAPVPEDGNLHLNGLGIEQFDCTGSAEQSWFFDPIGTADFGVYGHRTVYHIINQATGMCLDDRDGLTADRSPVQQWPCNGTSTTMQWAPFDDYYGSQQLVNLRGKNCLDVAGGSLQPGAVLQLYRCTSPNTAQRFFLPS
jgi:hypothetical protein